MGDLTCWDCYRAREADPPQLYCATCVHETRTGEAPGKLKRMLKLWGWWPIDKR